MCAAIKNTKYTVVLGHYGSGKTNISLNLALDSAAKGETVAIADLDIVNPYFRTCDYTELLQEKGIQVITSRLAGTTLDVPAITAEMYSIFNGLSDHVIIDVGGDDVGAYALGRFAKGIRESGNCEVLYVINRYRKMVSTPESAEEILREIECAAHLKATALVNNSHLCNLTDEDCILSSLSYGEEVSRQLGLPMAFTAVPKHLTVTLKDKISNLYPIDIIVKPPFSFDDQEVKEWQR